MGCDPRTCSGDYLRQMGRQLKLCGSRHGAEGHPGSFRRAKTISNDRETVSTNSLSSMNADKVSSMPKCAKKNLKPNKRIAMQ
ncbi:hypothetical protein PM082_021778 [Marasmius tenuissimus]|nr:hypothetical protein PM082_021778 [Marasmius tenuissimus]